MITTGVSLGGPYKPVAERVGHLRKTQFGVFQFCFPRKSINKSKIPQKLNRFAQQVCWKRVKAYPGTKEGTLSAAIHLTTQCALSIPIARMDFQCLFLAGIPPVVPRGVSLFIVRLFLQLLSLLFRQFLQLKLIISENEKLAILQIKG